MKLKILASTLVLTSCLMAANEYREYNTPVNYNYGTIGVGQASIDGSDIKPWVINGGGEGMITENIIYDVAYDGSIIDEDFFTVNSNNILLGLSYRFGLTESLDIVAGADAVYNWTKTTSGNRDISDSDFGYMLKSSLRYGVTRNLEAIVRFSYLSLYDSSSNSVGGSLTYYFNEYFGLGGTYAMTFGDDADISAYTGFIKYRF